MMVKDEFEAFILEKRVNGLSPRSIEAYRSPVNDSQLEIVLFFSFNTLTNVSILISNVN